MPPTDDDILFFTEDLPTDNDDNPEDKSNEGEAPKTQPNSPAVSAEEWAAAQEKLAKSERFQNALKSAFEGGDPSVNRDEELKRFAQDPVAYRQQIKEETKKDIISEVERKNTQQEVINKYRKANPDLQDFEPMVEHHAMTFLGEEKAAGRTPTFDQYIEEGIKRTRATLQKNGSQTSASRQVERLGMNLDLTGSQPRTGKPVAEVIRDMSDQQFEEYDRKIGARLQAQLYE